MVWCPYQCCRSHILEPILAPKTQIWILQQCLGDYWDIQHFLKIKDSESIYYEIKEALLHHIQLGREVDFVVNIDITSRFEMSAPFQRIIL